jgi:hypothetical protein
MAGIVVAVVFANSALLAGDAYRVERKLRNGSRALRDSVASAGETVVVLAEQDWSNFARWYDLEVQLFGEHPASRGGRVTVGPTLGAVGLLSGALSCTGKLELTSPDERRVGGKPREPEPVARLVLGSVMNFGEDSRTVVLDMVSETESGAAKSDPIFKN